MSSIYKNLSDEDLRIEKDLKNLERQMEPQGISKPFKALIVGGFILALMSAVGSAYLYQSINQEKRQREALEASQVQIQEKAGALEETSKKDRSEIEKLGQQLKRYETIKTDLDRQIAAHKKEISSLQTRMKEVEAKTAAMNEAAEEAQNQNDLEPVGPALPQGAKTAAVSSAEPTAAKSSQVLTVNRKFNFVVVNLGLRDNFKLGDSLAIKRSGKAVGSVKIEKIYDNFSAATIIKEPSDNPIKEGDEVAKA